ncbi:MAG: hypothetical protein RLZZ292_1781 [Bacteroidota bacterium]|jgi:carbonic anhydrase
MKNYENLLISNKEWAKSQVEKDPLFFERLLNVQQPEYLWIGCSDSRVPPNEITQTRPGEMFIHRNIANLVVHSDMNLLSVLQYAVEVLEIKHIIVCGHYGCGGVKAAMSNHSYGVIDNWLRHIKDVYRYHQEEVDAEPNETAQLNKLIELNIMEQVNNLAKTSIVQQAWKKRNAPYIHGWVYDLHDGIIKAISEVNPDTPFEFPIYAYK